MATTPSYRLYKWPSTWGLPSSSPACIEVEAYIRLANLSVAAEDCASSSTSPSGQLPALEHGLDVVEATGDEQAAARGILAYLRAHGADLDARLNAMQVPLDVIQKAEALAFGALVEAKLEPATAYTTWCEWESYSRHTRAAFGAGLPLPLSYWLPWTQRRAALRRFGSASREQVYGGAAAAYAALADHLRGTASKGNYFFGAEPCSLDAALFAHLALHHSAPVSAPELRQKLREHPMLVTYVEHISSEVFSAPLPAAPPITSAEWAQRAEHVSSSAAREKKELSARDKEWRRGNQLWLAGAGAAILAYFLLSGQYIQISLGGEYDEDADEDE